jgi:DNA-binding LacI/PurR family transcriptional regulator
MTQPRTLGIVARFPFGYFFNTVLFGVQAVARQHHLNVLVIQGTAETVAATQIARDKVDAWLVMSNGGDANTLLPQGKPTISIGMRTAPLRCSAVLPDNRGGIEAAMQHLAAHGHEQIAFVGWTELGDIQERYEGYQAALAQRGQALDLNRVVFAQDTSMESGRAAVQTLIERGMPCTAIVAATDLNALGIMQALQQAGYNVPGDVAVIGFDDVPLAQSVKPSLSTVRQSFEQLGVAAAQQALAELAAPAEPQIIFTPVQFLPRQSCGCQSSAHIELAEGDSAGEQEWQAQLGRALVQTLAHP